MNGIKFPKRTLNAPALLRKESRPVIPHHISFFEGPEKLLEITFTSVGDDERGLRVVDRKTWEEMLKLVKCEILSCISNEYMDAFMLSESSLFVCPNKIILKTCGTTTLLHAVPRILDIAEEMCNMTAVGNVFFSRKNYLKPHKQLFPHTNFDDEVNVLDGYFDGSAHILGRVNDDHWYLYLQEQDELRASDQTLEILMHDLHPDATRPFFRGDDFRGSRHASKISGIMDFMPGAEVDDLVFEPFGYSANGILGENYFTIHVTPQPECSFASFETNRPLQDYTELIQKVLCTFRPGRFTINMFSTDHQNHFDSNGLEGYVRKDKVSYEFNRYNLFYACYRKATTEIS